MKDILKELIAGNQVLLETDKLPDFWKYCMAQKGLYSFIYEYTEAMVKITINKPETILIQKSR